MPGDRLRIYVDTSVTGGCLDPEFEADSRALIARFAAGEHVLVLSTITEGELQNAPAAVRDVLADVPSRSVEKMEMTAEAAKLADFYLAAGVIPRKMVPDAQHIALATLAQVDVLV